MQTSRQQLRAQARAEAFREVSRQHPSQPRRVRRSLARRLATSRWRRIAAVIATIVALSVPMAPGARGQGSRKDDIVFNSRGVPLAGATVRVCVMPASGQPCTPLALIYSDAALTQALANPTTTDGLGNYFFYAAPGKYEIEFSGPGITTKQIPNVVLPSDPTSPSFSTISSSGGISAFSLNLTGNLTVSGNTTVVGNLASGTLNLTNQSTAPGAAGTGTVNFYTKTADKRLYYKDDTGTEIGPIANTTGAQTNVPNTFTATQTFQALVQCKNLENVRCVDAANSAGWSGTDAFGWISSAMADLPAGGGTVDARGLGTAQAVSTPMVFPNKPIRLILGVTTFTYTGTYPMWTFNQASPGPGYIIDGAGKLATVFVVNNTSAQVISITDQQGLVMQHFGIHKASGVGGDAIDAAYIQRNFWTDIEIYSTANSVTWVNGVALDVDANGSTIYNEFNQIHVEPKDATHGSVTGCALSLSPSLAAKVINGNHFINMYLAGHPGATGLCISGVAGARISENVYINGEYSANATGISIGGATITVRDEMFIAPTVENNTGTGVVVGAGGVNVNFYGAQIGSNGTNETDAGLNTVWHGNIAGVGRLFAVDPSGNLNINGLGFNSGSASTNSINFGTGGLIAAAGANLFQFTSSPRQVATVGTTAILGGTIRGSVLTADQGTACTNGELALSAGWGNTPSPTVTAVVGVSQTCEWTITSGGAGQAANPTITDTLVTPLPAATIVCDMRMVGGTGAATLIDQTTLSSTAPVFTFGGTPGNQLTYKVVRRCGP